MSYRQPNCFLAARLRKRENLKSGVHAACSFQNVNYGRDLYRHARALSVYFDIRSETCIVGP